MITLNRKKDLEKEKMHIFEYGQKEIDYLKSKDKKLGAAIDKIGIIKREVTPDPFEALISSVVGQQISSKAADTVWNRLVELLGNITPESISQTDISKIQACGMSQRKAGYITGIAEAAISGEVDFNLLQTMSDEEIIKKLSSLHGVGEWTAEMLLIFSLNRPDVVSYKDLAIRRGMMNLYGHKELPKERFERYKKRYSPYGSVASLYLWALSVL
ncbi:MAG: DNA-3-methyladenine glycosidase [Clostridia bacterium]|jgi:3-methyladenine DNA glycosylase/8-oxoguanine DNA glycosylase|nr:DNA-3-methyladenine glycosidase [Clostridia bacterium]